MTKQIEGKDRVLKISVSCDGVIKSVEYQIKDDRPALEAINIFFDHLSNWLYGELIAKPRKHKSIKK